MLIPRQNLCAGRPWRAFTLLEIMVVVAILGIVAFLGLGALRRYNAQNDLHRATARLMAELINAQTEARAFGTPQMRSGLIPPILNPAGTQTGGTFLRAQITKSSATEGISQTASWSVGDEQGSAVRLMMITANLPLLPYVTNPADQGLTLELGDSASGEGAFTVRASVAFQPDGSILVVNATVPTTIVVGNGISNETITLTSLGKANLNEGP